ncbi:MAG: VWA domain-containing protein [Actinobacteria bacterium]|nr:VWA domain-containing protein [Actinomycetota bacterium]
MSPELGKLDETAFAAQLARDGDAALALLADLAAATDPALRRAARRLAERLLPLVLLDRERPRPAAAVVDDLLSLRGHGTTDLARALRVAGQLLEEAPPGGRTAILMSDALPTAGEDPLRAVAGLDCLHVLGTSEAPDAVTAGRALARRGHGRYLPAARLAQLTESLRAALA